MFAQGRVVGADGFQLIGMEIPKLPDVFSCWDAARGLVPISPSGAFCSGAY
jgi:hypothetical protein